MIVWTQRDPFAYKVGTAPSRLTVLPVRYSSSYLLVMEPA
jgi:hypothetical protein